MKAIKKENVCVWRNFNVSEKQNVVFDVHISNHTSGITHYIEGFSRKRNLVFHTIMTSQVQGLSFRNTLECREILISTSDLLL